MHSPYLTHLREIAGGSCHAIKAESVPPSVFSLSMLNCQPLHRYTHAPVAYSDVATDVTIPCQEFITIRVCNFHMVSTPACGWDDVGHQQ